MDRQLLSTRPRPGSPSPLAGTATREGLLTCIVNSDVGLQAANSEERVSSHDPIAPIANPIGTPMNRRWGMDRVEGKVDSSSGSSRLAHGA